MTDTEALAVLAIEATMDWRLMSSDAAIRRDAPTLYPKWKPHLERHGLQGTFARNAKEGMDQLAQALCQEAMCASRGKPYKKLESRTTFDDLRAGLDRRFPNYTQQDGRIEPAGAIPE